MLDPEFIRNNPEIVKNAIIQKNMSAFSSDVDEFLKVDEKRRKLIGWLDELRSKRNELTENIKNTFNQSERDDLIKNATKLKTEIAEHEEELKELNAKYETMLNSFPNIPSWDTPVGKDDSENVVVEIVGKKPEFDFEPLDHVQIAKNLDLIDFEAGAKVVGSQFYFLKNELVLLEMALLHYGIEKLAKKGFTPVITPDLAKSRYYLGTGYNPRGDEAQIYEIDGEDLGLVGSAEITMAGYHADEIIENENLPIRYAAISHCFRKEAGTYGKYSKGLYRVHQFTKLELFIYCTPEESEKLHQEILAVEKEITEELGLHFRVLLMCTGDIGAMASKKYDLEAWMPGRNDFGEITSTSNCTDFQARNLNIKFKNKEGENQYIHMLNGTAIVLSRIPLAILENYQRKDGSVGIPSVLQKYMGITEIKPKTKN